MEKSQGVFQVIISPFTLGKAIFNHLLILIFSHFDSFLYQVGEEEAILLYKTRSSLKSKLKMKTTNESLNFQKLENFLKLFIPVCALWFVVGAKLFLN